MNDVYYKKSKIFFKLPLNMSNNFLNEFSSILWSVPIWFYIYEKKIKLIIMIE